MAVGWRQVVIDGSIYWYWEEGQRRHRLFRERPTSSRVHVDLGSRATAVAAPPSRGRAPPPFADVDELLEQDDAGDRAVFGLRPEYLHHELRDSYRRLVQRHHPDRGGDLEAMKAINAAYSRLHEQLRRRHAASRTNGVS